MSGVSDGARAIAWMALSMSCIAIVDGIAKHLARELNGVQVAWGYFLATLVALGVHALATGIAPAALLRARRPRLQLARAACLVLSLSSLFFSLRYLPLAEATIISFMSPLFIVALAGPMLGERVGAVRWAAVLVGLAGAALVVRPGTAVFQWPALVALTGAAFFALFNVTTRLIGASERWQTTLAHTFGIGTALLTMAMPFVWKAPSAAAVLTLASTGALGLVAHLSLVRALTLAEASMLAPLTYLRLLWALAIGLALFGEAPDTLALLGGTVIVASGLYVATGARRG